MHSVSDGTLDSEEILLLTQTSGDYLIRVLPYSDVVNTTYDLLVEVE